MGKSAYRLAALTNVILIFLSQTTLPSWSREASRAASPTASHQTGMPAGGVISSSALTSLVHPNLFTGGSRGSALPRNLLGDPPLPAAFALNLSSAQASIAADNTKTLQIVTGGTLNARGIVKGGVADTINPGQLLTPAQYVALGQVMATGKQSLVLNSSGSATGGFLTLDPGDVSSLSSLTIPASVTVNSVGFLTASPLAVTGAAVIDGSLYALQRAAGVASGLSFASLTVGSSGLISTSLPANANLFAGIYQSSGLNINVGGSLKNAGTIASSGNLNLYSGSGTFVNSGLISATAGNITLASQGAHDLSINNSGGTLKASSGAINVGDASWTNSVNTSITGGNLLSKQLNLYSGSGTVDMSVGSVTGQVNVTAGQAHVTAATNDLILGNMNLSGDPSFYNTAVNGDVTIGGDLIFHGQDLAIVASRDVLTTAGAGEIDTSYSNLNAFGNGGNVTIVAGAQVTATSSSGPTPNGQVQPPTPDANDANITLTITSASASGGKIDLVTGGAITSFNAESNNGVGGNVTLVAFNGTQPTASNPGTINLPTNVTITTNGNVNIIAGALSGTPVNIGPIDTSSHTPTVFSSPIGYVTVSYGNVTVVGGNESCAPCVTITGGTATSGAFSFANPGTPYTVATGNWNLTATQGLTISSFGTLALGSLVTNGSNLAVIAGQDVITSAQAGAIDTSSSTTDGGNITIVAGAQFVPLSTLPQLPLLVNPTINITGASPSGGKIDLATGTPITSFTTKSTAINNAFAVFQFNYVSGSVNLIAFNGTSASNPGTVTLPANVTITTSALANGGGGFPSINGDVNIIAGATSGTPITIGPINAAGGAANSGNILASYATPNILGGGACAPCVSITSGTDMAGAFVGSADAVNDPTRSVATGAWSVTTPTGITVYSFGTIQMGSFVTHGGSLFIASAQDIVSSSAAGAINTSSTSGSGGNLTIVAGANITPSSTLSQTPSSEVIQQINVNGNSGAGGQVDLVSGTPITGINTSSTNAGTNHGFPAGNIFIGAFSGTASSASTVNLPANVTITADALNSAAGRAVTVIASTINVGSIEVVNADGGNSSETSNSILVQAANLASGGDVLAGNFINGGSFGASLFSGVSAATGSLTVNGPSARITAESGNNPFNNGTLSSNLFINGSVSANGGEGIINITDQNVSTTFQVGPGATTNGINGTIQANGSSFDTAGGSIGIENQGVPASAGVGGIQVLSESALSVGALATGIGSGNGGNIRLESGGGSFGGGGPLTLQAGALSTSGMGTGLAGRIILIGTTVAVSGTGALSLTNNGGSGQVHIFASDATNNIIIGSGNQAISISATGGSADIQVSAGQDLNVDMASFLVNGGNNNIQFTAGRNLFVNNTLNAGANGSIALSENSSTVFVIGAGATVTGVNGSILAAGGNSCGNLTVSNSGTGGITLLSANNINIQSTTISPVANGVTLDLESPNGPMTIGAGILSLNESSQDPWTNSIILNAKTLALTGTGPVIVEANGAATSNSSSGFGLISITAAAPSNNLTIGTGNGQLELQDTGGGGGGGGGRLVSVIVGGNLTVNAAGLIVGTTGSGGAPLGINLNLVAGTAATPGTITMTGALRAPNMSSFSLTAATKVDITKATINIPGQVVIGPYLPVPITIGTATFGSGFTVTNTELANITAGTLVIGIPMLVIPANSGGFLITASGRPLGSAPQLANITLAGNLNISTYKFTTLELDNTGNYIGTGHTLTLGNHNLNITMSANVHTGTITGLASNIAIITQPINVSSVDDDDLVVNGPITVASAGSVLVSPGHLGNLLLQANISGGLTTTLEESPGGNITQTAGTVSGTNLLVDSFGEMGSLTAPINTAVKNMTLNVVGGTYINQSGAVTVQSATVGFDLQITASGSITTTGALSAFDVVLQTTADSNGNINLGSAIITPATSMISAISLVAGGSGQIQMTAGSLIGPGIVLTSTSGNIGSLQAPIQMDTAVVGAITGGSGNVFLANRSTTATVVANSVAGGSFQLTASAPLSVGNIRTQGGSISLSTTSGALQVVDYSTVTANGGNITLQSLDTTNGSISIGPGAVVSASSPISGSGNVYAVIGAVPAPTNTTAPANVSVNALNSGQAYFGTNSITASAPINTINVDGKQVIFNTGALPATAITINGGATINATPYSVMLSSLDLTNPATVAQIQTLISKGIVTGTLKLAGGKATTGTTITINANNLDDQLTADDIPSGVIVNLQNVTVNKPLLITLNASSSQSDVIINGSQMFSATHGTSYAQIYVASQAGGNVLQVSSTGHLTSDGNLFVNTDGNIVVNGKISADVVSLQTNADSNGSITIGSTGTITGSTEALLFTDGLGNISGSGSIHGAAVVLGTVTGFIGSATANLITVTQDLTANAVENGNIYIKNTGAVMLESSTTGGNFQLLSSGQISVVGDLTANAINLQTATGSNAGIAVNSNIQATGSGATLTMLANGSGSITEAKSTLISGDQLAITSTSGNLGTSAAPLLTQVNQLTAKTAGNGIVDVNQTGDIQLNKSSSGSYFVLSSSGAVSMSSLSTSNGLIFISAASGNLNVVPSSTIAAKYGVVVLDNTDTNSGTITIGKGTTITSTSNQIATAQVEIFIGSSPTQAGSTKPGNVTASIGTGGTIFYGNNGFSASAPTNTLTANKGTITFDTDGGPASSITLGGSVRISTASTTTPPPAQTLTPTGSASTNSHFLHASSSDEPLIVSTDDFDTNDLGNKESLFEAKASAPPPAPSLTPLQRLQKDINQESGYLNNALNKGDAAAALGWAKDIMNLRGQQLQESAREVADAAAAGIRCTGSAGNEGNAAQANPLAGTAQGAGADYVNAASKPGQVAAWAQKDFWNNVIQNPGDPVAAIKGFANDALGLWQQNHP